MVQVLDPEFWGRLVGIAVIDLTLAGDNALVIALAVRTLPARQQLWGRIWGTAGAVGLRLLFIALASLVLAIPLAQLVGGLVLIWIAVKLVCEEARAAPHVRQGGSLAGAIWIIVVADAVMSLDNVLAVAAAARGDMLLVGIGIGLSLPLVVWGSGLLSRLMGRFPAIVWIGGGVLGYVAGEMIHRDRWAAGWLTPLGPLSDALPVALAVIVGGLGWWRGRRAVAETASAGQSLERRSR